MSFCFIVCFLRYISLALFALRIWGTSLPSGPSGERTPFRFLECDAQGGDSTQIKGADGALAWMFSQVPFVSENKPIEIVSLSWPTNMEAQDLFPLTSSMYTLPTGTKVEVPCFAFNKAVGPSAPTDAPSGQGGENCRDCTYATANRSILFARLPCCSN